MTVDPSSTSPGPLAAARPTARTLVKTDHAATSGGLPDGVSIQPRRFEFERLGEVPQYWFADNPILTHVENAFSILIPPGERFFIQAVRNYEDRADSDESKAMIRAFAQQEGWHTGAHNEFNSSLARFGIDIEREEACAKRAVDRLQSWLPKKVQLGATAFLEHLTATGAHSLFLDPEVVALMDPEMRRFWQWHAAEELEHKAVAFDLFGQVGGGYGLRVLSAIAAIALLAGPFGMIAHRLQKQDPNPITGEMRQQARAINRKLLGLQLRMLADYFRPSFHPWDYNDEPFLREWYESTAGA